MPSGRSALGSAPTTSARPPGLANGAHSEATNSTFRERAGRVLLAERGSATRSARVDPVVDLRKDVVPLLDVGQPPFVDLGALHVVVDLVELQDVLVHATGGVGDGGAGLHDEGPVAGLGQHQLARRLV